MTPEQTFASPAGQHTAVAEAGPPATVVAQRAADRSKITLVGRAAQEHSSRALLLAVDTAAAVLGTAALTPAQRHPLLMAGFVGLVLLLFRGAGLYRRSGQRYALDDVPAVAARTLVAWCFLAAAAASVPRLDPIPATAVAAGCLAHGLLAFAGRTLVHWRHRAALARRPCSTLLVGPQAMAVQVAAALQRQPRSGIHLVGIVAEEGAEPRADGGAAALPLLTTLGDMRRAVIQNGVRRVLLLGSAGAPEYRSRLRSLAELRCEVWELDPNPAAYVPARRGAGQLVAGFCCRPLVGPPLPVHPGKRALDLALTSVLLVLAAPVLLVCALWLRIGEGPGVVFRQERIGKDGRPFTLLKFRTYRPSDSIESATRWSVANEQRMSWFCRFLRRTSLDELLQLWNVFRGDMSLVGPRPERPYFVMKFSETHPGYSERHRFPTGITGLAQINGLRGDTSIEDRCRFDNAYIDTWSPWQDISILIRTAAEFFRPTGS